MRCYFLKFFEVKRRCVDQIEDFSEEILHTVSGARFFLTRVVKYWGPLVLERKDEAAFGTNFPQNVVVVSYCSIR